MPAAKPGAAVAVITIAHENRKMRCMERGDVGPEGLQEEQGRNGTVSVVWVPGPDSVHSVRTAVQTPEQNHMQAHR